MNHEHKQNIKDDLEKTLGRPAKTHEIANMETDALLLAQFCIKKIEELEKRITDLEKK